MARKRMISIEVYETDAMINLPPEAQALYVHLLINADDDGFNDKPRSTARMIGVDASNINKLIEKGFLIAFSEDLVVIRHWELQNHLSDKKKADTVYEVEKKKLMIDDKKRYALSENNQKESGNIPENNQNISGSETITTGNKIKGSKENQVKQRSSGVSGNIPESNQKNDGDFLAQESIGEESIGEESIGEDNINNNCANSDHKQEYLDMFKNNVGNEQSSKRVYSNFIGIVEMYNEICKSFECIDNPEEYTEAHSSIFIDCFSKGYSEEDYRIAFNKAENSDYLKGTAENSKKKNKPSELPWMLKNLDKIINGDYDNFKKNKTA